MIETGIAIDLALSATPRSGPRVWVALAGLVLLATFFRIAETTSRNASPSGVVRISGDEFVYVQLGDRLWREGRYTAAGLEGDLASAGLSPAAYLASPVFKHPPVFAAPVGFSRLVGRGTLASAYWPLAATEEVLTRLDVLLDLAAPSLVPVDARHGGDGNTAAGCARRHTAA